MAQPSALIKILAPSVPSLLKTAFLHSLNWSPDTAKWDLRTALIITTLRGIMGNSRSSISKTQHMSAKDPGIKGPMWVAKVTAPVPTDDDVRQLLFRVIDEMKEFGDETYSQPESVAVEAEWTGYRAGAGKDMPQPEGMSEATKFQHLMDETASPTTILYFHGGAHYLCDPATHRRPVSRLCKKTKGRAYSVRYRLSPQHPFPSALLDAIHAYLALLYPPPGSLHDAVDPKHIVFAGDSAGGNVVMALLAFVLQLHHTNKTRVYWNGREVEVPIPVGAAMFSPWTDVARAMPSLHLNAKWDFLPVPPTATSLVLESNGNLPPGKKWKMPQHVPCDIWPAKPPRADIYCDGETLIHPLVSPLILGTQFWKDSPPLFMTMGEEELADEGRVILQQAHRGGVPVRFYGFEAMPHCFGIVLEGIPQTVRAFDEWARAIREMSDGGFAAQGVWVEAGKKGAVGKEIDLDLGKLTRLTDDEVRGYMVEERKNRIKIFEANEHAAPSSL